MLTYEIFLDADGVLYDFDARALELGFDLKNDPTCKSNFWKTISYRSKKGLGFWNELPLFDDAHQLVDFAKQYNCSILTAMGHVGTPLKEKAEVFQRDFKNIPTIFVRRSTDKARFAAPNRILVDDRLKSIQPWVEAGGIGILHTSVQDSLQQLKAIIHPNLD